MPRTCFTLLASGLMAIAVACGGGDESTPTATPTAAVALTSTATATAAAAATTVASSSTATSGGAGAAAAVFAAVSPGIAFVETYGGTGSAILLDERRLITNAHVVWPYETLRVVFPDGTEFIDAPVSSWDLMADLAIIELPAGHGIEPLVFGDPRSFAVGTELYLIGYPAETERFPQPTISRGVLSRFREWERADVTYVQTDASITGGQSGGALVSAAGEVVGLSGFSFGEQAFGIALSAPDVEKRIALLSEGGGGDTLSERRLPMNAEESKLELTLDNYYDERAFVYPPASGPAVTLSVTSENDVFFNVTDAFGHEIVSADESLSGEEFAIVNTDLGWPAVVRLGQYGITTTTVIIESSAPLALLDDPDDARLLRRGKTHAGNLDYVGDFDYFEIDLDAGETVRLGVDTVMFDPVVRIDRADSLDSALGYDDDSGGGTFGLNSLLEFTATEAGRYLVVVNDAKSAETGGYYLVVE